MRKGVEENCKAKNVSNTGCTILPHKIRDIKKIDVAQHDLQR